MELQDFEIAKRIQEIRTQKDIKQNEMCEMVGVSPPTWYKIENAQTVIKLPIAMKIAKVLEISLDYLVYGTKEKEEEKSSLIVFDQKLIERYFIDSIQKENSIEEMRKEIEEVKELIRKTSK